MGGQEFLGRESGVPGSGGQGGVRWQRRLRAARIEAAVTNTGTALVAAAVGIAAVVCYVAQLRGGLQPGTWALVLAGGGAVVLCKAVFDFRDRANEGGLWRVLLIQEFGEDMRKDSEAARLARLAIEFRVRLSEAEAKALRPLPPQVSALLPQVDTWLDLIVGLARKVASLRGEARFQAGVAAQAKDRVALIEAQARAASDPVQAGRLAETARGLSAQVRAFDGFNLYVADAHLRLEHAVGAFTAACSQLGLDLARGAEVGGAATPVSQIGAQIGSQMAQTEQSLVAIETLTLPNLPEMSGMPALPGTPEKGAA